MIRARMELEPDKWPGETRSALALDSVRNRNSLLEFLPSESSNEHVSIALKNPIHPELSASFRGGVISRSLCVIATLLIVLSESAGRAAATWEDISSELLMRITNSGAKLDWPGGCSGVVVNRTNGDLTIKVVGQGLWRSSDHGKNWARVDGEMISGRDETGWATNADANAPGRLASFSLDGHAGWTTDGMTWKRFATLGRNWDYGSVDWSAAEPKTIIAAKHETSPPGEIYLTRDGGVSWRLLGVHLQEKRERISMVGALGGDTVIYSNGDGIQRSADAGRTWSRVSDINPLTRIPVYFDGVHYLGCTNGLLTSVDRGATWKAQGAPANIWIGPLFGATAREMLVVGKDGVFATTNGGTSWTRAADLKPKEGGFVFTPNWFGCYAWDPVNKFLYASSMGNPVYRLKL